MHDVGPSTAGFIRNGDNVTVTIGRNVGTVPMRAGRWAHFAHAVVTALSTQLQPGSVFEYLGTGEWDGVSEDSCSITFVDVQRTTANDTLDAMLSVLASQYDQDAIAWHAGPGHLARR